MRRYRKTGKGLLGLIDRHKTPLICILTSAFILAAYSFACADDLEVRRMQGEVVKYIPFVSEYTDENDRLIEARCMELGLDEKTAIAIARLETGHYTSKLCTKSNNFGGMSNGKRYYTYETKEEGIQAFTEMLKSYADKGMTRPKEMQKVYCPSNSKWAEMVDELRGEIR